MPLDKDIENHSPRPAPSASEIRRIKHRQQTPMLPVEYWTEAQPGKVLPASVVYVTGGTLVPSMLPDPDLPPPVTVAMPPGTHRGKLPNGLTAKADAMARLMARNVAGTDAYRACFKASGEPIRDAQRAWQISRHERFKYAVREYRAELEREQRQAVIEMQDFVKGRLVHEAQTADQAPARIRALELLGKTEGMFVDIKRTERAINPNDLRNLKDQLEQRLRRALLQINPKLLTEAVPDGGTDQSPTGDESGLPGPDRPSAPLFSNGSHPATGDSNSPTRSPISRPPVSSGSHREMSLADLGL